MAIGVGTSSLIARYIVAGGFKKAKVLTGALQGTGDIKSPMCITAIGMFIYEPSLCFKTIIDNKFDENMEICLFSNISHAILHMYFNFFEEI